MEKENLYRQLRWQVLSLRDDDYRSLMTECETSVYAAMVDMDMGEAYVTLACFLDGTTSLYFSTGGGMLGLGQEHEQVQKATLAFLINAQQAVDQMDMVEDDEDFQLPKNNDHRVYLFTSEGIRVRTIPMGDDQEHDDVQKFLSFFYQNLLAIIGKHRM